MTTMIERVARAICRSQTQSESMWQAFLPEATAAIEEMRVPNEGMVAAADADRSYYGHVATNKYTAMIDAALAEQQP